MITPDPPAGSEHYREGWRHGYEQAAIDRERSADAARLVPATLNSELKVGAVPDTGHPPLPEVVAVVETAQALAEAPIPVDTYAKRRRLDLIQLIRDRVRALPEGWRDGAAASPSGDTVQTPAPADLAYARSEVDKWLATADPYCILPTRTEHIPALLARLDELEGTR